MEICEKSIERHREMIDRMKGDCSHGGEWRKHGRLMTQEEVRTHWFIVTFKHVLLETLRRCYHSRITLSSDLFKHVYNTYVKFWENLENDVFIKMPDDLWELYDELLYTGIVHPY